jgi:hypothetical protein
LTVTFRGQEFGYPYLAAGFDVTNRDSISIAVANVQIQVWSNGFWAAHSTKYMDFVVPSKPGGYELPNFEPGETKRIFVEWPKDSRWRIKLTCGREVTGASRFVAKSWFAIRRRERPNLQGRMWIACGSLFSAEVPPQKTRD